MNIDVGKVFGTPLSRRPMNSISPNPDGDKIHQMRLPLELISDRSHSTSTRGSIVEKVNSGYRLASPRNKDAMGSLTRIETIGKGEDLVIFPKDNTSSDLDVIFEEADEIRD